MTAEIDNFSLTFTVAPLMLAYRVYIYIYINLNIIRQHFYSTSNRRNCAKTFRGSIINCQLPYRDLPGRHRTWGRRRLAGADVYMRFPNRAARKGTQGWHLPRTLRSFKIFAQCALIFY